MWPVSRFVTFAGYYPVDTGVKIYETDQFGNRRGQAYGMSGARARQPVHFEIWTAAGNQNRQVADRPTVRGLSV